MCCYKAGDAVRCSGTILPQYHVIYSSIYIVNIFVGQINLTKGYSCVTTLT